MKIIPPGYFNDNCEMDIQNFLQRFIMRLDVDYLISPPTIFSVKTKQYYKQLKSLQL